VQDFYRRRYHEERATKILIEAKEGHYARHCEKRPRSLNGSHDLYRCHNSEDRPAERLQGAQDCSQFNYSEKRPTGSSNGSHDFNSFYTEERSTKRFNGGNDIHHSRHPEEQPVTWWQKPHNINDARSPGDQPTRSSSSLPTWALDKYDNYLKQMQELITNQTSWQVVDPTGALMSLHVGLKKISEFLDAEPKLDLELVRAQLSRNGRI
jgi:hypothetical protein